MIPPLRERPPDHVTIVEVAPRDGLRAEARRVSTDDKVALIEGRRGFGWDNLEELEAIRAERYSGANSTSRWPRAT